MTQAEISEKIIPLIVPEHNNIKPDDDFNRGYLRAIDIVKAKALSVISRLIEEIENK